MEDTDGTEHKEERGEITSPRLIVEGQESTLLDDANQGLVPEPEQENDRGNSVAGSEHEDGRGDGGAGLRRSIQDGVEMDISQSTISFGDHRDTETMNFSGIGNMIRGNFGTMTAELIPIGSNESIVFSEVSRSNPFTPYFNRLRDRVASTIKKYQKPTNVDDEPKTPFKGFSTHEDAVPAGSIEDDDQRVIQGPKATLIRLVQMSFDEVGAKYPIFNGELVTRMGVIFSELEIDTWEGVDKVELSGSLDLIFDDKILEAVQRAFPYPRHQTSVIRTLLGESIIAGMKVLRELMRGFRKATHFEDVTSDLRLFEYHDFLQVWQTIMQRVGFPLTAEVCDVLSGSWNGGELAVSSDHPMVLLLEVWDCRPRKGYQQLLRNYTKENNPNQDDSVSWNTQPCRDADEAPQESTHEGLPLKFIPYDENQIIPWEDPIEGYYAHLFNKTFKPLAN